MSDVKNIITSKYDSPKQYLEFNEKIKSLPKSTSSNNKAVEIQKLYTESENYKYDRSKRNLHKYVKDSDKYDEAIDLIQKCDEAKEKLKDFNFKRTLIIDESYTPNGSLSIFRIDYSVDEEVWEDCYNHDYYDDYGDDQECDCKTVIKTVEYFYYVERRYWEENEKIVHDLSKYLISYSDEIVKDLLDLKDELYRRIDCYVISERFEVKHSILQEIFPLKECDIHLESALGSYTDIIEYKNKSYFDKDIKLLAEEYGKHKNLLFIKDDEYVEYPEFSNYVDFKEKLESGVYKYKD